MATIDFRMLITFSMPAYYSFQGNLPHSDETIHHFGLREPLRQKLLDVLSVSKDELKRNCIMHFGVSNPPADNYIMEINIYDYLLNGEWAQLSQMISNIMALSPYIVSITIVPHSSRSSFYYHDHIPEIYDEYSGRIPFAELLKTQFVHGTKSLGTLIVQSFRNLISQNGYLVVDDPELNIIVSR